MLGSKSSLRTGFRRGSLKSETILKQLELIYSRLSLFIRLRLEVSSKIYAICLIWFVNDLPLLDCFLSFYFVDHPSYSFVNVSRNTCFLSILKVWSIDSWKSDVLHCIICRNVVPYIYMMASFLAMNTTQVSPDFPLQ